MGAASGITQALEGAKHTLKEANAKFPSPKPSGQHANASYKMARKPNFTAPAAPAPAAKSSGEDAAEGIKNNQDNVKAYQDAEKQYPQ
jgi:hypothetical protein